MASSSSGKPLALAMPAVLEGTIAICEYKDDKEMSNF